MQTLSIRQGTAATYTITLANAAGALAYTGSEPLTAVIWAGDNLAAAATLTPTWLAAGLGQVSLTIPAATTTALEPQAYTLSLTVTTGGLVYEGFRSWLRVEPGPKAETAAAVWCSYDDMLRYASWLDQIQSESDTAGFAEQRARATAWAIEQGMARVRDMLDSQFARHAPRLQLNTVVWSVPDYGVDLGPQWGQSSYWQPEILADFNTWRTWFADTAVIQVDDRLKEIVARFAISLACAQQLGQLEKTSYQTLADRFRRSAISLLAGYTYRFLTASDTAHPERRLD